MNWEVDLTKHRIGQCLGGGDGWAGLGSRVVGGKCRQLYLNNSKIIFKKEKEIVCLRYQNCEK